MKKPQIESSWHNVLKDEFEKSYFQSLMNFIDEERLHYEIYPPEISVFKAFDLCPVDKTRVVLIGQDPYHGQGQANGLCFSVKEGLKLPPSLKNIFKELNNDIGLPIPKSGDLTHWANQGVLMLNATLTVRASTPGSHQNKGWETFTDEVIKKISKQRSNLVFILWGSYAQKKGEIIVNNNHYILKSAHPSPFSAHRGFLGNNHFSLTNNFLKTIGEQPIQW